ncbi:MAG: sensor histidine kinase, partial [Mycobacteriales bacterium]
MSWRLVAVVVWGLAVAAGIGLAWQRRRRVDIWARLPVPAALVDSAGQPVHLSGPGARAGDFVLTAPLPAPGQVTRIGVPGGGVLAVTGLAGGALALAVDPAPARTRSDRLSMTVLARAAHELQNPVAAVLAQMERLESYTATASAEAGAALASARRELLGVSGMLVGVLQLAQMQAAPGVASRVNLVAVVEEAAVAVYAEAVERGVEVRLSTPGSPVAVHGVHAELLAAVRNLMTNALRHGRGERAEVEVAVRADAASATVVVRDSGPGISPEALVELREAFTSAGP